MSEFRESLDKTMWQLVGVRSSEAEMMDVHRVFEAVCRQAHIRHEYRDIGITYTVDFSERVVRGVYPITYVELWVLLLYVSELFLSNPRYPDAMSSELFAAAIFREHGLGNKVKEVMKVVRGSS